MNILADYLSKYGRVLKDAPMKDYTTFKSGGNADIIAVQYGYDEAASIVRFCSKENIPLMVIGAGSNLLVGDRGIRGVVMRVASDVMPQAVIEMRNGLIYSQASVMKTDMLSFASDRGFSGIEFMAGIPGAVGGGIMMNAGTFMGTFIDFIKKIEYIDKSGEFREIDADKNIAHYRGLDIPECAVVVSGIFEFPQDDPEAVKRKIEDIINDRKAKHPWTYPSAGSVFKNPEGGFAWKLVNDSGLKGYRIGGAQVSELHTNFIVNAGNAASRDIRALVEHVQSTVKERFGVNLHTEIKMIGEF